MQTKPEYLSVILWNFSENEEWHNCQYSHS